MAQLPTPAQMIESNVTEQDFKNQLTILLNNVLGRDEAENNPLYKQKSLSTLNLNTVTASGFYNQFGSSNATTENNYPIKDAGFLTVQSQFNGSNALTFCVQRYIPQTTTTKLYYERKWNYATSTWGAWYESANLKPLQDDILKLKTATKSYEIKYPGNPKNLIKTANLKFNKFVNTSGSILDTTDSGWAITEHIPVVAGENYTISGTFGYGVYSFFNSETAVTGSLGYLNFSSQPSPTPRVITAPPGATHVVLNVQSKSAPYYSKIMLEKGSIPTDYVSGDDYYAIDVKSIDGLDLSKPYEIVNQSSKNLFKVAEIQEGLYLNTSGQLRAATNWGASGFIPVTPGEFYTISGVFGYSGAAFFQDAVTPLAPLSYTPPFTNFVTIQAPANAAYLVINLYRETSTNFSRVQVEKGKIVTPYESGDAGVFINRDHIYPPIDGLSSSNSKVKFYEDDITVEISGELSIQHVLGLIKGSQSRNGVINFKSFKLDNSFEKTYSDDVAPLRLNSATVGANHGWNLRILTCPSHGKTSADIGSVWQYSSTIECVIVDVPDVDTIHMVRRSSNDNISDTSFIHVSGATNQSVINPTSGINSQWYPSIKSHIFKVIVDGKIVQSNNSYTNFTDTVKVSETYEILDREALAQYFIGNVGQKPISFESVKSLARICNNYIIDNFGGITAEVEVMALNTFQFVDMMAVQAVNISLPGGSLYYIPKTLPYMLDGKQYNFSNVVNVSGEMKPTQNIIIDSSNSELDALIPDRVVQLGSSYGMAIGYLQQLDAVDSVRKLNNTGKYIYIPSSSLKIYPYLVDKGLFTANKGDSFAVIGYRNYFKRNNNSTCQYIVKTSYADYLFLDWHINGFINIDLPIELAGRQFSVVEKSANIEVKSKLAISKLSVNIGSGRSNSYLVLKFEK